VRRFIQGLHRRGLRLARTGGRVHRRDAAGPQQPYAASKAGADLLARSFWHTHNLPAAITRCSNNYGPYQFPEKLIPLLVTNAMSRLPLPIYGDGLYVRDWIHVRDHCEAIDRVLHHGKEGEVYNIGARQEMPNLEIARRILEAFELPESMLTSVKDRPATTGVTPSIRRRSSATSAGSRRSPSRKGSARRSSGTAPTRPGWSTSAAAPI